MMGSGGMIVMDENNCMVDVANYFLKFLEEESCGKCTPCREGILQMRKILDRITSGEGKEEDLDTLEWMGQAIIDGSLCALGGAAPNPVITTMRYFRDEYETHIRDKKCPAGICKALIKFSIDPENCTGCHLCARICPVEAATGEKKEVHTIDDDICIKCRACYEVCKFDAIKIT
jgi:ferredoxin